MTPSMNDKNDKSASVPGTGGTQQEAMTPTASMTEQLVATAMPTDPTLHDGIKDPPVVNGTGFESGLA
ncbi:hypothetical protein JQX13_24510 [Archangium violaceum]|uniref:hypothetical protein n=1 Tax=Archangium violaceum TaxID=83451 RepID=UPI00193B6BD7|nr:hypothetical protein [Archangium violaceum]QRK12914.1 hypothetical protein JQX13_24510 [Archangium violaceum]